MSNEIEIKYYAALNSFIDRIKADNHVIAALLAGSLSYDVVWEKSDIDLVLIVEDAKVPYKFFSIVEDGVIINTSIYTRYKFKRQLDASLNSSQFSSFISKAKLLFTKDDTIRDYFENSFSLGECDKSALLLVYGSLAVAHLNKAQKWLFVKNDCIYAYFEISKLVDILAHIEVLLNNDTPLREAIQQAITYNSSFFKTIYVNLAQQKKDFDTIKEALNLIENYISDRTCALFQPVLDLLKETDELMGASELCRRLLMKSDMDEALILEAYEWLYRKNIIGRLSSPVRITTKSRMQVDEAAYYYDGGK